MQANERPYILRYWICSFQMHYTCYDSDICSYKTRLGRLTILGLHFQGKSLTCSSKQQSTQLKMQIETKRQTANVIFMNTHSTLAYVNVVKHNYDPEFLNPQDQPIEDHDVVDVDIPPVVGSTVAALYLSISWSMSDIPLSATRIKFCNSLRACSLWLVK